jgi:MFS family permease
MEAPAEVVEPARREPVERPAALRTALLRPAAVHLAGQLVVLAVVWVAADAAHKRLWDVLQSWDARQLLAVSQFGYPDSVEPGTLNSFAFFPAFPLAARWTSALTGISLQGAGIAVSVVCGIALAYAVDAFAGMLGADDLGRVRAVLTVATLPLSVVLVMPYTEAMFCALAVWALVCGARDRWLAAGVLAAAAGLVRPTAVAVVLAVWVGAALAWRRGAVDGRRALAAAVVAPLGALGYVVYVAAVTTGSITGWSDSERKGWDTRFDYGRFTWSWVRALFQFGGGPMDSFIVAGAVVAVLTVGWLLRERQRLPAAPQTAVYVLAVTVVALGTSGMWGSKYRFLLPGLVVSAVLAAVGMARWRGSSRVAVLLVWILAGAWFSGYALVAYHFAI